MACTGRRAAGSRSCWASSPESPALFSLFATDPTMNNHLSPAQMALAANAAQRITLARRNAATTGERLAAAIPLDELECLARAAAPALGMDPDGFDLGAFVALPDLTAAQRALTGAIQEGGRTV